MEKNELPIPDAKTHTLGNNFFFSGFGAMSSLRVESLLKQKEIRGKSANLF